MKHGVILAALLALRCSSSLGDRRTDTGERLFGGERRTDMRELRGLGGVKSRLDAAKTRSSQLEPKGGKYEGNFDRLDCGSLTSSSDEVIEQRVVEVVGAVGERREPSMMQINLLMFFFYLTLGSALPYIPLYYRKLGLADSKIGMLGAITPTMNLIASPLWGALADSRQWHKEIMVLTFVASVAVRYGLYFAKGMNIWALAAVVCTTAILNAPVKPLMDSAVMDLLPSKNKSAYGRSRFYGQVGFGLGSYLVSPLIGSSENIKHIFHAHLLAAVPTVLLMASFKPGEKVTTRKSAAGKMKEAMDVFVKDKDVLVFFFMVFLVGSSSGIIENFAYVRISEVGGETSGNILGTIRLISSIAGGPMFWLSGRISKRIGPYGILVTSLLSYTLRFFIYALIQSPWQALPAELA